MSRRLCHGRRVLAAASALAVSVSLPANALASDRAPTPAPSTIRAAVERVVATESHRLVKVAPGAAAAQTQSGQSGNPRLESGSFFKTPAGIAVLAAFGAGVGYALYSASNDRIRSSER